MYKYLLLRTGIERATSQKAKKRKLCLAWTDRIPSEL